jgi:thymidylate synthase
MGQRVAAPLGIPVAQVAGMISSAHVYLADWQGVEEILAEAADPQGQAALLDEGRA